MSYKVITSPSNVQYDYVNPVDSETLVSIIRGTNNPQVVIFFTAVWCGPSKQMQPVCEALAKKYGNVLFLKVDVDNESYASQLFKITHMPTFFIMDKGSVVAKFSGSDPERLQSYVSALNAKYDLTKRLR